jgi:hypothetical protein
MVPHGSRTHGVTPTPPLFPVGGAPLPGPSRASAAACSGPEGRSRLCFDRRARHHRGSGRQRQAADAAATCAELGHGCRRHRCVLREALSVGPRMLCGVASRGRRSRRPWRARRRCRAASVAGLAVAATNRRASARARLCAGTVATPGVRALPISAWPWLWPMAAFVCMPRADEHMAAYRRELPPPAANRTPRRRGVHCRREVRTQRTKQIHIFAYNFGLSRTPYALACVFLQPIMQASIFFFIRIAVLQAYRPHGHKFVDLQRNDEGDTPVLQ